MEKKGVKMPSMLLWSLVAALVSQNLLMPVMSASFEDQKNYYTPDPHIGTPPSGLSLFSNLILSEKILLC